jgi:hypothetical protein
MVGLLWKRATTAAALAACTLLLLAGCGIGEDPAKRPPGVVAPPIFQAGDAATPAPSAAEAPAQQPAPSQPAPLVDSAILAVPHYCLCLGPRNQGQIKLKVSVSNTSVEDVSIDVGRFRLAVSNSFASEWTPKGRTAELASSNGMTLVPPNADGDWENFEGAATFATHWPGGSLPPGQAYSNDEAREADLVFYVPVGADGSIVLNGLFLLNDAGDSVAFLPYSAFGTVSDPNTF